MAANSIGRSDPFQLQLIAPGERLALDPGTRVRAVWVPCHNLLNFVDVYRLVDNIDGVRPEHPASR